jgi:transcriptional regulator with XRE-family HTH domain
MWLEKRKEGNSMKVRELRRFRGEVGGTLHLMRATAGVTLQDVADELGVSYQMVQHWEKGTKALDISRFVEICQIFKQPPGRLINTILRNHNGRKK